MGAQTILLDNGVRVACRLSGDPSLPAMVLLHALGEQAASWVDVAPRFASSFRVVTLDLRGHGASDWPGTYSFELMRDDVIGVLDNLDLRIGQVFGPTSHIPQDKLVEVSQLVPDCALMTIPAGHNVHESQPAAFADAVLAWLGTDASAQDRRP